MKRNICLKDPAFILLISNSPSDRADPHSSSSSAAWLFSVRLRLGVPRFQPHFENFRNYMFHVHDSRRSPRVLHDVRSDHLISGTRKISVPFTRLRPLAAMPLKLLSSVFLSNEQGKSLDAGNIHGIPFVQSRIGLEIPDLTMN